MNYKICIYYSIIQIICICININNSKMDPHSPAFFEHVEEI